MVCQRRICSGCLHMLLDCLLLLRLLRLASPIGGLRQRGIASFLEIYFCKYLEINTVPCTATEPCSAHLARTEYLLLLLKSGSRNATGKQRANADKHEPSAGRWLNEYSMLN